MDFVAIMIFTQQVTIYNVYFSCISCNIQYFLFTFLLIHENVNILNQISACIKSVAYKKACNIVLKSSKHEETTKKKTFKLYGHFFIDGVQLPQG